MMDQLGELARQAAQSIKHFALIGRPSAHIGARSAGVDWLLLTHHHHHLPTWLTCTEWPINELPASLAAGRPNRRPFPPSLLARRR